MKSSLTLLRTALLAAALLGGTAGMFALQQTPHVQFSNIAASAGIQFRHENGATTERYLPETMSAGALFFDYDNDGWLDIFLVNGGSFGDTTKAARAQHRLYRNTAGGTYRDVTASSGIEVSGFGMGACSADYDNDGWADLYVTSVGGNKLYHNTGKNGFTDVTPRAGVAGGMWSSSCAFADVDNCLLYT